MDIIKQYLLLFPVCNKAVADIVFVLDDSGSVTRRNFEKVKLFTIGVVSAMKIGYNQVRVAVVSFSSSSVVRFNLRAYRKKWRLIKAIRRIRFRGGGTNTHIALRTLRYIFTKRQGDRSYAPNIAIVLTDGVSSNPRAVKREAAILKAKGIVMFSIGIGRNLRKSDLRAMASKPISQHKFTVKNFNALRSIKNKIAMKACQGRCMSLF